MGSSFLFLVTSMCPVGKARPTPEHFVIAWDDVVFYCSPPVIEWFTAHPWLLSLFPPPYSPFHSLTEELNECWMSGHVCRQMPVMGQACRKTLSQVYCKRRHKVSTLSSALGEVPIAEERVDKHCCISKSVAILFKYVQ